MTDHDHDPDKDRTMDMPPPTAPEPSRSGVSPLVIGLLIAVGALVAVVATLLLTGNGPMSDPEQAPAAEAPAVPDSDEEWGDGPISFEAAFLATYEEMGPEEFAVVCDLYYREPSLVYGMFRADLPMEDVSSADLRRLFDRVC